MRGITGGHRTIKEAGAVTVRGDGKPTFDELAAADAAALAAVVERARQNDHEATETIGERY